eukprot:4158746-Amphidinium_carterae.1
MVSFYTPQSNLWTSYSQIDAEDSKDVTSPSVHKGHSQSFTGNGTAADSAGSVPPQGSVSLYGHFARRAVNGGAAGQSASSAYPRISRMLTQTENVEEVFNVLEGHLQEFSPFHSSVAVHRLARHAKNAGKLPEVLAHPSWESLAIRLSESVSKGEPRQLSSIVWSYATLLFRDAACMTRISE